MGRSAPHGQIRALRHVHHEDSRMAVGKTRVSPPDAPHAMVVTVLVDEQSPQVQLREHRHLIDRAAHLAQSFTAAGLPATWAVSDPAGSRLVEMLRADTAAEVALLVRESWLGECLPRGRARAELERRLTPARAAGMPMTSIVPYDLSVRCRLEIFARSGITALGGNADSRVVSAVAQPTSLPTHSRLRHGIWQLPVTIAWPTSARRMVVDFTSRGIRRRIRGQLTRGHAHLQIRLVDVPGRGSGGDRRLTRLVEQLTRLHVVDRCPVLSLRDAVAAWMPPTIRPQRSILRLAS